MTRDPIQLEAPSREDLRAIADIYNLHLTDEELRIITGFGDMVVASYARLDALPEPKPQVKYRRDAGRLPAPAENPLGAWAWKCSIKGAEQGLLSGKSIAVKDTVAVAGVPLLNGSAVMEGYVPGTDATIVTRILDAGGEIAGKAVCENMCTSSGSHTSFPGPVKNPRDPEYMAGGSSSGSAALVAAGEVDMSIGGDQAGSIRIPSSWCGVYGLKPTWGLVPYTGIFPIEPTLDHAGPIAASVYDLALLLEVIAGRDGLDPRQVETPIELPKYTTALQQDVNGMKIGLVEEGFGWPDISEDDVDEVVHQAAGTFEQLGAKVAEVSVPLHRDGGNIWAGILVEGAWTMMTRDGGVGRYLRGYYDSQLLAFYRRASRTKADALPLVVKAMVVFGHYVGEKQPNRYYAKAQNLRRLLRDAYDQALNEFDLLLMPTTPKKPKPLRIGSLDDYMRMAMMNVENTCPFDLTGHPAMNVPCGEVGGLPVGLMLVGRPFAEPSVLTAAHAFERVQERI